MIGFTNTTGLLTPVLGDARFVLITHLAQNANPSIVTDAEFETWWNTDEIGTLDLKIHRGHVGHLFQLLSLSANGLAVTRLMEFQFISEAARSFRISAITSREPPSNWTRTICSVFPKPNLHWPPKPAINPILIAVINRTVVHEGERIEGYQVMSIQTKGVWLKHQGKTRLLPFSEITAS